MSSSFERVSAPAYLADLADRSLADVRAMRDECQVLENAASYMRRFVQGRLDLVAAARRGDHGATPEALTTAMSASPGAPAGNPRPPQLADDGALPGGLLEELESIITADELVRTEELAPARIEEAFERLSSFEQQVSTERRTLHEVIDQLQAEIVRRYRSGEASVDGLLS